MNAILEHLGVDDVSERALFLLHANNWSEIPTGIVVGCPYFVSLLVCDAAEVPSDELARCARSLLKAGCVYFCCWGAGCERVHDIVDEQSLIDSGYSVNDDESVIMTTWHDDESLEEAAWFALNVAFPDDRYFNDCRAVVAITVGSAAYADGIRTAFADPRALVKRVVAED